MPPKDTKQYRYDLTVFETGGTGLDGKPVYGACMTGAKQGDNTICAAPTHLKAIQDLLEYKLKYKDATKDATS